MKTTFCLFAVSLGLGLTAPPLKASSFEVHEWGTFTSVAGSNGAPLQWYQPSRDLSGLPLFVLANPFQMKGAPAATLRMETPVIYFYPPKPMGVKVRATMLQGRITESFPSPVGFQFPAPYAAAWEPWTSALNAGSGAGYPQSDTMEWQGDLLPPQDPAALAQIPAVPPGIGEHYAQARNVADAWIFRSPTATVPTTPNADKFIFYRGAGNFQLPLRVTAGSDKGITIQNFHSQPISHAFALRVRGANASWTRLGRVAASTPHNEYHEIPSADQPLDQVAADLSRAMEESLVTAGLTKAEAAAMVATWKDVWFKEQGLRVLCFLPPDWINKVLPLQITPAPEKLTRVFVARVEVFTIKQEETFAALLDSPADLQPTPDALDRFRALQLGRFGSAALERAIAMKNAALQASYNKLQDAATREVAPGVTAAAVSAR